MIPQETVNLILDTARIEEVIGDFVTLKRRGASLVACCPFHNEKTPSFYVTPSKGIYKCFGCGKAGSAVGFVMEHEHLSYAEALKYLAHKYHIEVKEKDETPEDIALRQKNESLMLVMDYAQKFYVRSLHGTEGRSPGLSYLRSRGLDDDIIERFGLGWAPAGRRALTDAAVAEGYKIEYLDEAGLVVRHDDGNVVDRFFERAMFPIHSLSGRVIAYSGRTLKSDGIPKYVNSPETPLYIKSKALYGIYLAKGEISRTDKCYLAEGNVDVVSMHQIGITNTVASCGTSLTVEQIRIIKKFTGNVTVMYDGDGAGIHAAQRAVGMILKEGMDVRLVLFPDGDDPDSYCRRHTLEEVQAFIGASEMDFVSYMIKVNPLSDNDPLKRAALVNMIADNIALIPDPVKRAVFVDSLSEKMGMERSVVLGRIKGERRQMAETERKEAERARRREDAGLAPDYDTDGLSEPVAPAQPAIVPENRIVLEAEKELLRFMLCYGTEVLDFESDSEYYSGDESEKPLVADFIRCSLEDDEAEFLNISLRNTYNAYISEYEKGCSQEDIIKALLNSPDRSVASVTADLSMEKHLLTVKNFEDSLTTTSSWLVNFVPRALLVYAERRLVNEQDKLLKAFSGASEEEQMDMMIMLQKLKSTQKKINVKLGRE